MRATSIFAAAGLLSLGAESIQLVKRDQPAVVQFGIEKREVGDPVKSDRLRRRQSPHIVQQILDNELTLYFANVSMGTPPQNLRLHVDTGSSDLWTNSATSRLCRSRGNLCGDSGTYDANSSSTYQYVSSDFNISYVDGSAALGDYATDTLRIGGVELRDLQFGIGYLSSSTNSILGIGYASNEVQVGRNGKEAYANLPQLMVDQGLIESNAFSLWLDDLGSSTGQVLFGGVNTEKYHGSLFSLPVAKYQGQSPPSEFIIEMSGLSVSNSNGQSQSIPGSTTYVLLDSGSSLTYLPDDVASVLFKKFGAKFDTQSEAAYVPCTLADSANTLDFTFIEPVIRVPMNELVIDVGPQPDGSRLTFRDGTPACLFGISGSGSSTNVLGDTFLRSAYVVYDLENNQISLAQTNFNSTQDDIKVIGKGLNSVPDATGVPGAGNPIATASGGGRIGLPTQTGSIDGGGSAKSRAATLQIPLGMMVFAAGAFGLSVM